MKSPSPRNAAPGVRPSRRGVALLVVLGFAVILLSIVGSAVSRKCVHRIASRHIDCHRVHADLLDAAGLAIQRFLENDSENVVLAPNIQAPRVEVMNDEFGADGRHCRVTITAIDECACLPLEMLRSGSVLRGALPLEFAEILDRAFERVDLPSGLDELEQSSGTPSIFPQLEGNPALGDFVRPPQGGPSRLNVNTAPRAILEAVCREHQRGGIEQILRAREEGKKFRLASVARSTGDRTPRITLASSSDCWAFRIDIHIDGKCWSWWETHTNNRHVWRLRQRYRIDG